MISSACGFSCTVDFLALCHTALGKIQLFLKIFFFSYLSGRVFSEKVCLGERHSSPAYSSYGSVTRTMLWFNIARQLRGQGPLRMAQPKYLLEAESHAAGCPGPWKHRKSGYKNKHRKSRSPDALLGQGCLQQSHPHHPLPYRGQRNGCLPLSYCLESRGCMSGWACCLSAASHRIHNSEQQPES